MIMKKMKKRWFLKGARAPFLIFATLCLAAGLHSQENAAPSLNIRGIGSRKNPSGSDRPAPNAASRDPGVKLGWTSQNLRIPPELKELAQAGAEAISQQDWKKAREIYLQMTQKDKENPLGFANLGVAEFQLKNYAAAEGNLAESLRLNPSIAPNWVTLGLIQFERSDLYLAISSLTRAVHEDPKSEQAHLYLAAVTFEKGWTLAAIDSLNRVVELNPKNGEAHYNLALTYLTLKPPRIELARRHYHGAIDLGQPRAPELEKIFSQPSPSP